MRVCTHPPRYDFGLGRYIGGTRPCHSLLSVYSIIVVIPHASRVALSLPPVSLSCAVTEAIGCHRRQPVFPRAILHPSALPCKFGCMFANLCHCLVPHFDRQANLGPSEDLAFLDSYMLVPTNGIREHDRVHPPLRALMTMTLLEQTRCH